ncbi:Putative six-hairpin glycosidase superfamily, glycosyl hydrolase, family 88 [Septoria linicola]|uniref:Six-hairpin glycosidase superfamily, glycosyl hydrolase, family 88 n=1 Tax=Septoria linicola TaxID=215465 RepID=A0A9Q9AY14_9PEZI|nr:Putative six-hairpin glycosidase superfamily, glycosyl hydrolase, family 88 [Septoria linicola]
MLESNIARGQGLETSSAATGLLEIGFFQQAVHESITSSNNATQKQKWKAFLESSIVSANSTLANATKNTELVLDRLSIGSAIIRLFNETRNETYIPTLKALQQSVVNQKRNANGGLWYFDNQLNLTAYRNLSYLDGMYSYAPFAILSREFDYASDTNYLNEAAAWKQVSLLRSITERDDGLSVHGYDPTKNHTWAQGKDGASPVVWSRSQAWYTLGIVNSIELLETQYSDLIYNFKDLYHDLVVAQLDASDRSLAIEGNYGVWQVVDRPGATFDGKSNFIEASSSLMTAYSLLRGARMGWLEHEPLRLRAQLAGVGIFNDIKQRYLLDNQNSTLSLNGTSSVASLSGNVDYEYYITRPTR